ncbi:MAG: DUF523 domain-containing protein [Acidiferrobacterales bacterium]
MSNSEATYRPGSGPMQRIRIGVSSCLLGNRVRYDGTHKCDPLIVETLGELFDFVPICPEMAIGMGVPRPPIRLQAQPTQLRAVGIDNPQLDVTVSLRDYAKEIARELQNISGYIFKSRSPSCGIDDVQVYDNSGEPSYLGVGIFAQALTSYWPLLPVTDECCLSQSETRADFVERVFSYRHWQDHNQYGVHIDE